MGDLSVVSEFPPTWQCLWGETRTVQCMTCGIIRPFTLLATITRALASPCPRCGSWDAVAYDSKGDRASVRCGTGHGSTIATFGCIHFLDYLKTGKSFASPLYVPGSEEPVLCSECEASQRQRGEWDVDHLGLYCLFCMGNIIRGARLSQIPIVIV